MKLNEKQKIALLLLLGKHGGAVPLHEVVSNFDKFCNEEITEWRIFGRYGFAGKVWNYSDSIYVSGYSPSEVDKGLYSEALYEISKINYEIKEAMECYK